MSSQYGLANFVQDVESRYKTIEPATFWDCESAVLRLITQNVLREWLNQQLRSLLADPQYLGNWTTQEAILHRTEQWTLSIVTLDTPRRFIHALPFTAIYVPLDSELIGERYRLPKDFRNDVFDPNLRLDSAGSVVAAAGVPLRLETGSFAYDFHITRPVPVLRFASAALRPLEWLFSKNTLQAWQANDAEVSSTQLRVAAYVLGKIAHHSSVEPLRSLSSHQHHAVRWAAIQNLGRLSRSEALVKIRAAIADPHPHVRRAAQKTLDHLDRRT